MYVVRVIFACILLLGSLSACATVPSKKLGVEANPVNAELAEAKLIDANQHLDSLNEQIKGFYADLERMRQDIAELYQRPGWPELKEVLVATPSIQDPEVDPRAALRASPAFASLASKWDESWEMLFDRYVGLVDRCTILEARRVALLEKLLAIEAKYIGATMLELTADKYEEGKAIYAIVDTLGSSENELNSYTINAIGLYDPGPA